MNPITDEQVDQLPLDRSRSDLLTAIVSTPVDAEVRQLADRPRRRTAVLVGVAAASVAAIVALPVWLSQDDAATPPAEGPSSPQIASTGPSAPADGRLYPVVRGTLPDGWEYGGASSLPIVHLGYGREMQYEGDSVGMQFDIEIRDADDYEAIVTEETTQGGHRAGTIDVDGREARVWALVEKPGAGTGECTTGCVTHWSAITPVENGQYVLIIGAGYGPGTLAEDEWRALVASVELTDLAGFRAWAPPDVVFGDDIAAATDDAFAGTRLPDGFETPAPRWSEFVTRGTLRTEASIAAACAWVAEYDDGDPAARSHALEELEAVDEWPLYADLSPFVQGLLENYAEAVEDGTASRNCPRS